MEQSDEYASHTTLDLLLTMLHTNRQTCQIRAEVPSAILAPVIGDGTGGRGKGCSTCIIEGVIQRGRMVSISIRDQRGAVLAQGETAVRWSQYCGKRFWEVWPLHALHQEASFAQPSANE
ncbi:MAG: hypothetical protein IMW89_20375 [Ktedonobacteraceae bacterium]|nr:hypothetical protein [Ktedonobacteraceae bacterium]